MTLLRATKENVLKLIERRMDEFQELIDAQRTYGFHDSKKSSLTQCEATLNHLRETICLMVPEHIAPTKENFLKLIEKSIEEWKYTPTHSAYVANDVIAELKCVATTLRIHYKEEK